MNETPGAPAPASAQRLLLIGLVERTRWTAAGGPVDRDVVVAELPAPVAEIRPPRAFERSPAPARCSSPELRAGRSPTGSSLPLWRACAG